MGAFQSSSFASDGVTPMMKLSTGERVIDWDRVDFFKISGVYDEKEVGRILIKKALEAEENEKEPWMGTLGSLISQTMPERFKKAFDQRHPENAPPKPEEKPYTFWERIGAMPVAESRLRQRQYYAPYTDFRDYTYDEASPEEQELRAKWLSRMFDVSWHWPMIYFTTSFTCCLPLPPVYRTPAMVCCALTSVFLEGGRVYINAGQERENLDDFIVAKEFWYIKNVEALELGLVAKAKMTDEEKEKKYLERQQREAAQLSQMAMIQKLTPQEEAQQRAAFEEQHRRFLAETGGGGGVHVGMPDGRTMAGRDPMMPDPVQGMMAAAPGIPQSFAAGGGGGGNMGPPVGQPGGGGGSGGSGGGQGGGSAASTMMGVSGGFGGGGGAAAARNAGGFGGML